MAGSGLRRVCCTRLIASDEIHHWNDIPEELIQADYQDLSATQQLNEWRCKICQMPLFLDNARYGAVRQIGQGGFGRTFLAFERGLSFQDRILGRSLLQPFPGKLIRKGL
jgi:RecA-family ATPase